MPHIAFLWLGKTSQREPELRSEQGAVNLGEEGVKSFPGEGSIVYGDLVERGTVASTKNRRRVMGLQPRGLVPGVQRISRLRRALEAVVGSFIFLLTAVGAEWEVERAVGD